LPFIPLEKEVDTLIAPLHPILATFPRTLKETSARIGEAVKITMRDIDVERNTININGTEKTRSP